MKVAIKMRTSFGYTVSKKDFVTTFQSPLGEELQWEFLLSSDTFKCERWQPRKDFLDEATKINKFINFENF